MCWDELMGLCSGGVRVEKMAETKEHCWDFDSAGDWAAKSADSWVEWTVVPRVAMSAACWVVLWAAAKAAL